MRPKPPVAVPAGTPRSVVVVGASARAVAESAVRAGWHVHAADLFADHDLRQVAASAVRLRGQGPAGYPEGLPAAVAGFPAGPCVFTGGLENRADILAEIASRRPLAGSPPPAVRAVRDPLRLAALVRAAGLMSPPTVAEPTALPTDGSWLVKPRTGAGGSGIARWRGRRERQPRDVVWQRFVPGTAWGMSYLVGPQGSRLVGICRQFTGARWCRGRQFAYCGSITLPATAIAAGIRRQCDRLGGMLAADAGLVGVVGVDVVIDSRSKLHVIEINPRPTASLELIERETGVSLVAAHLDVSGFPAPPAAACVARPGIWSKAILFGPGRPTIAPSAAAVERLAADWSAADGLPAIRDIPVVRSRLPPHGPLVTVFARAGSEIESHAMLRRRVAAVRRFFDRYVSPPAGGAGPQDRPRSRTPSDRRPRSSPGRSP